MFDEVTGTEPKIVKASFADPYMLLLRDDGSIVVMNCDEDNEIEELEIGDALPATKWLSGSLYGDKSGFFSTRSGSEQGSVMMFLLSSDGGLHVSILLLPFFDCC
jgi:cleavage and polyadenylation specificity factor subunit 1